MKGILAQKIGMTRYISPETGEVIPVTVLQAPVNTVLQLKNVGKEGYISVVLGAFERNKFGKNENKKFKFIKEFKIGKEEELKRGDMVTLESLQEVKEVKVTGISKGKGFSGVVSKYHFAGGKETHGSTHHREGGSVGTCAKPGRIMRGKKMAGHDGAERTTIRSTEVIRIDLENNLIAVKGSVPGAKKSFVSLCAR